MQTFLVSSTPLLTARQLDYRRLGKQRVEAKQILMALNGETKGWVNHPATKMWRGYELVLCYYGLVMCEEWKRRGYKDTLTSYFTDKLAELTADGKKFTGLPDWFTDPEFHRAHQSNLVRKAPEFYRPLFPDVPDDLPYIWPEDSYELIA